MARGGVYDQLAGGFHRYSVDEHWTVPHFEKMSYDNSELLKNYVHGYQVFGFEFYAHVARDIVRWMDEWLSDREHGGFYASQDADINLDDDGDYFTWTRDEAKAVLSDEEFEAAALHYDIEATGEMHHNPAKNVLWVRALPEEVASRIGIAVTKAVDLLASAKTKLYAARLQRPTPFVDKTVYVNWNAMCVSAYLQAAQGPPPRRCAQVRPALAGSDSRRGMGRRTRPVARDRLRRAECSVPSVPVPQVRPSGLTWAVRGMLDDYAFTALACLDAYEVTGAISYFNFARRIADEMITRFADAESRRLLRHRSVAGREAAARRALGTAQTVSGCAHTCRKSGRRNRAAAASCLYQRGAIPRHRGSHSEGYLPERQSSSAFTPEPMASRRPGCRARTRR